MAFVVGELELFQHLLDALLDRQQLPGVGLLGQVERISSSAGSTAVGPNTMSASLRT
ncbi:hypothetical protein [Nonomuraea sp. NPDC049400]|uniref:hypothetical protein n=1 Tax=Nonomuraea sp. NPDC049400 TaxID=3364352 RepID=UPI003792C1B2